MEKTAKSVTVKLLRGIRNPIQKPEAWSKNASALTALGDATHFSSPSAARWCLAGAANRVRHDLRLPTELRDHERKELCYLGQAAYPYLFPSFVRFNDDPSTTHADVLAVLDRAIELAKAEETP